MAKYIKYFFGDWVTNLSMAIGVLALILVLLTSGNKYASASIEWYNILAAPAYLGFILIVVFFHESGPPVLLILPLFFQVASFWVIGKVIHKIFGKSKKATGEPYGKENRQTS